MEALATWTVDGQLGGFGEGKYVTGHYLAQIFFQEETDIPLAPGGPKRREACCATAAAVERLTDAKTSVKLLSGLLYGMIGSEVRPSGLIAMCINGCSGSGWLDSPAQCHGWKLSCVCAVDQTF